MKKNGFTLIELLAVIVILAILIGIAVPAVSNYITQSKRESYVVMMKEYISSVRNSLLLEEYKAPLETNDVTIISLNVIPLDKDKFESSFGNSWVKNKSYVAIVNRGSVDDPKYQYWISSQDESGYALPMTMEEEIDGDKIIKNARNRMEVTIQALCGTETGASVLLPTIKGLESIQPVTASGEKLDWNTIIYSSVDCAS